MTKKIRHARDEYAGRRIIECGSDSKKLWRVLNECLYNRNDNNERHDIKMLTINDTQIDNIQIICDSFNEYFRSIGKIIPTIKKPSYIPFQTLRPNHFSFCTVSNADVACALKELKVNASIGYDGISVRILRELACTDLDYYTYYINNILMSNKYPDELKIAKVIPIFKSGNKVHVENYRPISILTTFSKLTEKIIYNQQMMHLEQTNFFNANQYGFIRKSNTSVACINLVQTIQDSLDKRKITASLFIDLKKAFDVVKHDLVIDKLTMMNFSY